MRFCLCFISCHGLCSAVDFVREKEEELPKVWYHDLMIYNDILFGQNEFAILLLE